MKIANTVELVEIVRDGVNKEYNRSFTTDTADALIREIDPLGIHVIDDILLHEHIAGKSAPPHVRCFVYIKLLGTMDPDKVMLDIDLELFNALRSAPVPSDAV